MSSSTIYAPKVTARLINMARQNYTRLSELSHLMFQTYKFVLINHRYEVTVVEHSKKHHAPCTMYSVFPVEKQKSKVRPTPRPWAHLGGADLRFRSPQPDTTHQLILWDRGHGASASRGMSVYFPAEPGTHFTDLGRMEGWVNRCSKRFHLISRPFKNPHKIPISRWRWGFVTVPRSIPYT